MFKFSEDSQNRTTYFLLKNMSKNYEKGIKKAFYKIGNDLVREAKRLIVDEPKSGRIYKVIRKKGRRYVNHIASAPGEAPAKLSGDLASSLGFKVRGSKQLNFGYNDVTKKGAKVDYGMILETGGITGKNKSVRIAPRPYGSKAAKNMERNMEKHFEQQLKIATEKG